MKNVKHKNVTGPLTPIGQGREYSIIVDEGKAPSGADYSTIPLYRPVPTPVFLSPAPRCGIAIHVRMYKL